jgi:hypothetical protein
LTPLSLRKSELKLFKGEYCHESSWR